MGYIQDIRKLVGTRPIIMAGVSVIVLNEQNEILLQRRSDTGDWGVIGGALELAESLEEAAIRELYEEAGLRTSNLTFINILSGADMYYMYPHVNDDEGLELKFFDLKKPIDNLNEMARVILTKSKYLS